MSSEGEQNSMIENENVKLPIGSLASTSVPFWKDRKFWIHIALVGVQLYVYRLAIRSV